jgi:hypothetical protein
MAILGLVSTESVSSQRWTNIRRKVFYQYPNGAAPLIGLLSMMKEDETNDPEYSHWEKRLKERRTTTASQGTSKGPFLRSDGTTDAGDPVDDGSTNGWLTDTEYSIKVASTELFRPGHVIHCRVDCNSAASTFDLRAIVTAITSTTVLKVRALNTKAQSGGIDNGATNENVGKEVKVIGSAFAQGVVDLSRETYYLPVNPSNYTQIFRTPFSFTGNSLVTPVKFDDAGVYKDKAKLHSLDHMVEMELAAIFGRKHKYVPSGDAAPTTGAGLPIYTTGGIIYWLEQWEAGSLYENTAATSDSDDTKRIITNSAGTISESTYDTYLERIFRSTSNVSNEKLVLCGSGFLKVINAMYRSAGVLNLTVPSQDTFGMEIVTHKTPFGSIHYKSHPLFSQNATLRNNALFIDIHNLRYRPMAKRDTQLLKNRQPNDADYRKDEWFSEAGFEVRFPESFLYLQNVTSFTP